MKKFLSAFMVLALLLTCVACGKTESTNTDSSTTTESTTEAKTESTTNQTTDGETTTESITKENTTETKNENKNTQKTQKELSTKESSNTKPTEKPSNPTTEKATSSPTTKPTEALTEKPATQPSTSKPYFVSMDVVSVDRPNSFTVNGTHILDKIYGKNTMFQNGDTITYKINMSDGGTTGFKLSFNRYCSVTTNGNIITVKINGDLWSDAMVEFTVDTKYGSEKVKKVLSIHGTTGDLGTSASVDGLIREYAILKGMILLNGTESEPVLVYSVKVPGNSNWKSEIFTTIDKCANSGYKKYCYQLVPQDAFQISMHDDNAISAVPW